MRSACPDQTAKLACRRCATGSRRASAAEACAAEPQVTTSGASRPVCARDAGDRVGRRDQSASASGVSSVELAVGRLVALEIDAQGRARVPVPDRRKTMREPPSNSMRMPWLLADRAVDRIV